jgi:hypothetical protein
MLSGKPQGHTGIIRVSPTQRILCVEGAKIDRKSENRFLRIKISDNVFCENFTKEQTLKASAAF